MLNVKEKEHLKEQHRKYEMHPKGDKVYPGRDMTSIIWHPDPQRPAMVFLQNL